jgi:hypothetical protein
MVASTKRKAGAGAQPAFQDTNGIGTLPQTAPTPQAPRPWREVFKVHPAAEMFPLMSADELRELADDIKKNGLLEPVSYVEDGDASFVVIDGRNRLDALALLGIHVGLEEVRSCGESRIRPEIRYCEAATKRSFMLGESPEISDLTAWIVAKNIRRRHLNAEQKRDIIAKLLKATPEKSNRAIAKTVNVDHKTVAAVRNEAEGISPRRHAH